MELTPAYQFPEIHFFTVVRKSRITDYFDVSQTDGHNALEALNKLFKKTRFVEAPPREVRSARVIYHSVRAYIVETQEWTYMVTDGGER